MIYVAVSYSVMALATLITTIFMIYDYFKQRKKAYLHYRAVWMEQRIHRPNTEPDNFLNSGYYRQYKNTNYGKDLEVIGFFLMITLIAPVAFPLFALFLIFLLGDTIWDLINLRFHKYWEEEATREIT